MADIAVGALPRVRGWKMQTS